MLLEAARADPEAKAARRLRWLGASSARFPSRITLPGAGDPVGLRTRWITQGDPLHRRLQLLRYPHDCSDYFRLEHFSAGGIYTH